MRDGYVKVAVSTPELKVADCMYNAKKIVEKARELAEKGVRLVVFPELSITGYSCGDLFTQEMILIGAEQAMQAIARDTKDTDILMVVGMPLEHCGRLYNAAVVIGEGEILGIVPKTHIPNYGEFYEARQFASGAGIENCIHDFSWGLEVDFGSKLLFREYGMPEFVFGIEICEDLWQLVPPSCELAAAGARVIVNLSASNELVGKAAYRRELVKSQSARTVTAYLYANAGEGESTTDLVYAGHNMIFENGTKLGECKPFSKETDIITEIDIFRINCERRRMTTFPLYPNSGADKGYKVIDIYTGTYNETELTRKYEKLPFVPTNKADRKEHCNDVLNIQAAGLKKRLKHTGCKNAVIGLSGGLDSTLALLVTVRAFDSLGLDRKGIHSITMPCFGTTDRTYENAVNLAKELGTTFREIDIKESVTMHFRDIGHDINVHDVTYENAQARERTQVLMDIANQVNGMVIGTGDMSELALGWATYNGDHMSMYGVNASVPKTLVRFLVHHYADNVKEGTLKTVLYDVLETPVSPELLPPKEGKIAQKTEDIVGPYELHDFFLYYSLRYGYTPSKIFRMAVSTFEGEYDERTIYKWMEIFYKRFFTQQYKRSCLPDGPKVGSVSLSPRGDLRMPSDASDAMWREELDIILQGLEEC